MSPLLPQVVEAELREAKAAAAHGPPPPSTHSPHHGPRAARPSSRESLSIEQAEALSHAGYAPPRPVWMGPKTTTIVTPRSQQLKHALYASVDVTVRQLRCTIMHTRTHIHTHTAIQPHSHTHSHRKGQAHRRLNVPL